MLLESLQRILTLPLWPKLAIIFAIYFFWKFSMQRQNTRTLTGLRFMTLAIAARDILYSFFPMVAIVQSFDALILIAYFYWLRQYTGRRHFDFTYQFFTGLFILSILLIDFIPAMPKQILDGSRLYLIFLSILTAFAYLKVTPFNTMGADVIFRTKNAVSFFLVAYNIIVFLVGDTAHLTHMSIIPFSYLLHFYLLYHYNLILEEKNEEKIEDLSKELQSLFDFMRVMGNAISEKMELDKILNFIVDSAVKNTSADGGSILLVDEYDESLNVKAVSGFYPPPYQVNAFVKAKLDNLNSFFFNNPVKIGESILGESVERGDAIWIHDTHRDKRMIQNTNNDLLYMSSVIVIPLIVGKRILGVLTVCRRSSTNLFEEAEYNNMKTFANYASISLDNLITYMELLDKKEMEREVGIAAEIQQKLLPSKLPKFPGIQLAAYSKPAKGVSGDYYDVRKIRAGKLALVMCDVAGKGVPASLVMIMIKTIVQLIANSTKDVATIVGWINKGITGKIEIDHYATLSYLTYDPVNRKIEYSNAAHHPLFVYRKANHLVELVDTDGLPIGIEANSQYLSKYLVLNAGDIVLLYTDGIIEAMNEKGDQYSYERVEKFIKKNNNLNADDLINELKTDIDAFVGRAKQHDDQTLLIMKVTD